MLLHPDELRMELGGPRIFETTHRSDGVAHEFNLFVAVR